MIKKKMNKRKPSRSKDKLTTTIAQTVKRTSKRQNFRLTSSRISCG